MSQSERRAHDEDNTDFAGQSGDNQQISNTADSNSESVEELLEEGNSFEADAIQGVEDAEDPVVSEVITRQVPVDDVPAEYLDDDDEKIA